MRGLRGEARACPSPFGRRGRDEGWRPPRLEVCLKREVERAEVRHLLRLGELREQLLRLRPVAVRRQLEEFLQQFVARQRQGRRALEIVALRGDFLAVFQLEGYPAVRRERARRALERLDRKSVV